MKERHPFIIDDSDFAPTPACGVDPAAGGRGLPRTVDAQQNGILAAYPPEGTPERQPGEQRRTRHLATPVLGTPYPRRRRFCETCGFHPFQSGKTRPGDLGGGLAVFEHQPVYRGGDDGPRLGRRNLRQRYKRLWRERMMLLGFVPHPNLPGWIFSRLKILVCILLLSLTPQIWLLIGRIPFS